MQEVLTDSRIDLDMCARQVTVIMSTSVGDTTPSTDKVVKALESVQNNLAFHWCRKILAFDKVPSHEEIRNLKFDREYYQKVIRGPKWEKMWNEKRTAYDEYCEKMRRMKENGHPALFNVELVFLPSFGHLFGTVKVALDRVETDYVFITQHDLAISSKFMAADVQLIVEALMKGDVNYILLNRDINSGPRTAKFFRERPQGDHTSTKPRGLRLTGVAGFSDQSHFSKTNWYLENVINAIHGSQHLTCMEHILHARWIADPEWQGTCLYGGREDGPYIYDLVHGMQVRGTAGQIMGIKAMPERSVPT